jgi:hypothetical protein
MAFQLQPAHQWQQCDEIAGWVSKWLPRSLERKEILGDVNVGCYGETDFALY